MNVRRIPWLRWVKISHMSCYLFYIMELIPICINSHVFKSALFTLRLQHLKWYWQKIWRDKKHQYNQAQGNQSSNEWQKIDIFTSNGKRVRDTNCILTTCALLHAIGHKRSIEKNKLHNETFRHGHTNLTLPCSGRVTKKITKQYTHIHTHTHTLSSSSSSSSSSFHSTKWLCT